MKYLFEHYLVLILGEVQPIKLNLICLWLKVFFTNFIVSNFLLLTSEDLTNLMLKFILINVGLMLVEI